MRNIVPKSLNFKQPSVGMEKICKYYDLYTSNIFISNLIESKKPFMVSRFGSREFFINHNYYFYSKNVNFDQKVIDAFHHNAGFFSKTQENIKKYAELHIENIIPEIDFLGSWINNECDFKNIFLELKGHTTLQFLDPIFAQNPWSYSLKGKNVLVIHPFANSIEKQYNENRKFLFKNPLVLPEFNLKTLKAVQSIAGNIPQKYKNKTWFDALNDMYEEALSINFDIAIIGCGAYGMALAGLLKKAGKQAIHLGGKTQLLFGIIGQRWKDRPAFANKYFNNYWVHPSLEENIENSNNVENGCYW